MSDILRIVFGPGSKMNLYLPNLFPRTKDWLNKFERHVLRYNDKREDILEEMISYIDEVLVPGLPEKYKELEKQIKCIHEESLNLVPYSPEWFEAGYKENELKKTRKRWPKYCEKIQMNRTMLEGMKQL